MADCAAVFHTQPSEMDGWDLETLHRWHQKAGARQPGKGNE